MSVLVFCVGALLFVAGAGAFGQRPLIGGLQDITIENSHDAERALGFAVRQYNLNTPDNNQRAVTQVLRAQSQVVEGVKYFFTVAMAKTNCTKDSAVNQRCVVPEEPEKAETCICVFSVWSRVWLKSQILLEQKCTNE